MADETVLSEKAKMLRGDLYDANDPELVAERTRARDIVWKLNSSRAEEGDLRSGLLAQLFGALGEGVHVEPPFHCDYGSNIRLGNRVFFNFDCVILDVAPVDIGNHVMLGPAVQLYTATHPLDAAARRSGLELGRPIRIGDDVWLGGGAIVNPGVTIGARTVVGAGSVVTRDLPDGVFAAGNPCRVIRRLEAQV